MGNKWLSRIPLRLVPPLILSVLSIGLYIGRVLATDRMYLGFMNWNLFLAWLPLLFAWSLSRVLTRYRWLSWRPQILTFLWLIFLPNSFYMVTDFIHVAPDEDLSMLYDIVLVLSFALSGLILGCMSIYMVHAELKRRSGRRQLYSLLGGAILLSSFAIYLGRQLDYNSWDLVFNPGGILLDTLVRLSDPLAHGSMYTTTLLFFVFISGVYSTYYFVRGRIKANR